MSYAGHINPTELPCYAACKACLRCSDKGKYAKCASCSGRYDPELKYDPYDIDNHCDCKNGVLRWRTKEGKLIITPYPSNPFEGAVVKERETQDERDWNAYLHQQREKRNDPSFNPIEIT